MKSMMVMVFLGLTGCVSVPREHVLSCDDQEVGIGIDRAWKDGDTWQMVHVPDYWGKRAKTQYVQKPGQHCQVYVDTAKDY